MKILFAPMNIASMPGITAGAMEHIGHKAKCISIAESKYFSKTGNVIIIPKYSIWKNPFLAVYYRIKLWALFVYYLIWCDVVHWTWDSMDKRAWDLKLVKLFNKIRIIEWVGSDIRIPEITMRESKWYAESFNAGYEYSAIENEHNSYSKQERFRRHGFIPVLVPEMQLFLKPGLYNKIYTTHYRIDLVNTVKPAYPLLQNDKIVIVHTPSAQFAKGSNFIIPIIEKLQQQYPIDFILLNNMPRSVVLDTMKTADIFIDQIILGSYASAAIEAMSFGKPTLAYIMPSVYKQGIDTSCPIVNVNPDTLESKLIELIESPELRRLIGMKSRQYVDEVHNADKLAAALIDIYKEIKTMKYNDK
jgi:hypothetical protein